MASVHRAKVVTPNGRLTHAALGSFDVGAAEVMVVAQGGGLVVEGGSEAFVQLDCGHAGSPFVTIRDEAALRALGMALVDAADSWRAWREQQQRRSS